MASATRISVLWVLWSVFAPVLAVSWSFSAPLNATQTHGEGIFHHLGSGGRNGIAVSGTKAALVWEDNRDGEVRCYFARRSGPQADFEEMRVSGDQACYEPAVAAAAEDQFAVAWEERGAVWIRLVGNAGLGPPLRLSTNPAGQAVVTRIPQGRLLAAWSEKEGEVRRIRLARLDGEGQLGLRVTHGQPAEQAAAAGEQAYPDLISLNGGRFLLAWEDRRKGHTVILAASGQSPLSFAAPQQINESFWGGRALGYGRGTGAMRVSLASADGEQALAVWADKRNFRFGYDIFASVRPAGAAEFGANEKVQDEFADMVAQWHPDIAARRLGDHQLAVAVWDDDREGTPDIWMSWRIDGAWSEDREVPGASSGSVQVEPAVAMDSSGRLHLSWVEQEHIDGPSRIRYLWADPDLKD